MKRGWDLSQISDKPESTILGAGARGRWCGSQEEDVPDLGGELWALSLSTESTSRVGSNLRSLQSAGRCGASQMCKVSHPGRTWGPRWIYCAEIIQEAGKIQVVSLQRSSELHLLRGMGLLKPLYLEHRPGLVEAEPAGL